MRIIKYVSLVTIALGIFILLTENQAAPLLAGLIGLFVTAEKNDDERSRSLKASSAFTSLLLSYIFIKASPLVTSLHITEIDYFLILIFSLAIVIYYTRLYILLR